MHTERTFRSLREVFAAHIPQSDLQRIAQEQNVEQASRELAEALLRPLREALATVATRG
ncbi:MAG: hypothetical protein P2973_02980 [Gemmatimonadota bacterium]|nr:hypothetical protein [Gemmatimonadota bacterium]MDQ8178222.1 hypothetical protein [Gemmatimonadota bacterium]